MKKIIALVLAAVMAFALCACGAPGAPSGTSGTGSTEPAEKSPIKIEDIDWNTQLGIIDGERQFVLSYTNNSKYTIAYFCMTFTVKDELSEADQKALDELKTVYELEDSDIPVLELEAESEKLTDPGESEQNMEVLLGWNYIYSQDPKVDAEVRKAIEEAIAAIEAIQNFESTAQNNPQVKAAMEAVEKVGELLAKDVKAIIVK